MKCQNHDKSNLSVKVRLLVDILIEVKRLGVLKQARYTVCTYYVNWLSICISEQDFDGEQFRNYHEEYFFIIVKLTIWMCLSKVIKIHFMAASLPLFHRKVLLNQYYKISHLSSCLYIHCGLFYCTVNRIVPIERCVPLVYKNGSCQPLFNWPSDETDYLRAVNMQNSCQSSNKKKHLDQNPMSAWV